MATTFTILSAEERDVARFGEISTAAFRDDTHTLMKDAERGLPPGEVNMTADHIVDYIKLPAKCTVLKAIDNKTGEIVGWCAWGMWHYDGSHPVPESGEPTEPTFKPPPPLPETATGLQRLKHLTDSSMAEYQNKLCPLGVRTLYIVSIIVHPAHQHLGIGSAFIKWGTDKADQDGVRCWVHASEAGWRAFAKHDFKIIGALEVDLDEYASGPRVFPDGRPEQKWGKYTFRYMQRDPILSTS